MKDLLVIAMTLAFFLLTLAFIRLCDRIIGPDDASDLAIEATAPAGSVDGDPRAAPTRWFPTTRARPRRSRPDPGQG